MVTADNKTTPHRSAKLSKRRKDGRVFNPSHPRKLAARINEVQILQLRLEGKSFDEIAKRTNLSTSAVYNTIMRLLDRYDNELKMLVPQARSQEIERCREIIKHMWAKMKKGDAKAAGVVLKASERLSRLSGLDAPVEVDATLRGGLTVETFRKMIADEDPTCLPPTS